MMKRFCFLFISLLSVLHIGADQLMRVSGVSTNLNIRECPSTSCCIVGKVGAGEIVTFLTENDQEDDVKWSQIRYGNTQGWVQSKYLTQELASMESNYAQDTSSASNAMIRRGIFIELQKKFTHHSKSLMYWILGLGILMALLLLGDNEDCSTSHFITLLILFVTLSLLELYQIIGYEGDITWFYSPSVVGWLWSIINFILTVGVFFAQTMCFITCANFINNIGGRNCSVKPGLICMVVGLAAFFIFGLLRYDTGFKYSIYFIAISQVGLFVYWTYRNIRDGGNWLNLFIAIAFYIFGLATLLLVLAAILPTLLAVTIALFFTSGVGEGESRRTRGIITLDDGTQIRHSHSNNWVDITDSNITYERDWTTGDFSRST